MNRYTCMHPNMAMTLVADGMLRRVKFVNGVFQTEDPYVQAGIAQHPMFGRVIFLVGEPDGELAKSENPEVSAPDEPKKKARRGGRKTAEEVAIASFLQKD
jgi:hypothetical protein